MLISKFTVFHGKPSVFLPSFPEMSVGEEPATRAEFEGDPV